MKHQMMSILTSLSVALAPAMAFAHAGDGSGAPKNKCDPDMVDRLWKSDKQELKDEFQGYYLTKKKDRKMKEADFCDDFAERFNTAAGYCADGDCRKSKHKPGLTPQDGQDLERVAREREEPAPPRYRGDPPPPPRPAPAPVAVGGGGGFGDLFNGNPMGYMIAGGLGGLIGAMIAGNNNNNNGGMMRPPMFRSPYGPYGPYGQMGPGGMMNRPPPFMPYNQFGGAPAFAGGGMGGYGGGYAPGVISPYNGANIYNGGYMGSGAGAYSSGYFGGPPAVINAATGMRMYSVGGSAPATQYRLLGN